MNLTCVGCGNIVTNIPDNKSTVTVLSVSCHCGAYSPILNEEGTDRIVSVPYSLSRLIYSPPAAGKVRPHMENYLGFSEHVSLLKISVIQQLKELGLTLMADCEECRLRYLRELERVRGKSKVE